jgi:RimJ/RimL family protein N-acetyltransferase
MPDGSTSTSPVTFLQPINTERLTLRLFGPGDLDDLAALQARPDVTRYLYWSPRTREESAQSLDKKMASTGLAAEGDILSLAVTPRAGGPLLGDLTLSYVNASDGQAEVGYLFHPDAQGQGFATEAVRVLLELAFDELRVHRVMRPTWWRTSGSGGNGPTNWSTSSSTANGRPGTGTCRHIWRHICRLVP